MPDANSPKFRNMNELTNYLAAMERKIGDLEAQNATLRDALAKTQAELLTGSGSRARYRLPDTMLLSDSFWMRAFAVWGHYVTAQMIITVPLMLITFFLMFVMIGTFQTP